MVSIYGAALLTRGTPRTNSPDPSPAAPTAGVRQPLSHGTPDFDTVLPSNKSIDQLGGWTRVSPASSAPVYAYTDTIDHVSVIVSQQVLPNDLQRDTTAQLKQLASLYAPAEPLAGVSGAYISRSRSGPASVVCVRGSILIFVKTNDAVSDNALSSYITSLR